MLVSKAKPCKCKIAMVVYHQLAICDRLIITVLYSSTWVKFNLKGITQLTSVIIPVMNASEIIISE